MANKETKDVQVEVKEEQKPEFSQEELMQIFDDIIFSGEYSEEVTIKGKLKVTFKSRTAEETSAITKEIDSGTYNLVTSVQEKRALLNLNYSVSAYNGKDLSKVTIEDRAKFIGKLPAVVVAALSEALVKFDRKIDMACREGEENF